MNSNKSHNYDVVFSYQYFHQSFDFRDRFGTGWGTRLQVQRTRFDKILADGAEPQGIEIRYLRDPSRLSTLAELCRAH